MINESLKVLLISPLPPPAGGIATWTVQFLDWAKKNNLNVNIVDTSLKGSRAAKINSDRNISDEVRRTINILKDLKKKIKEFDPNVIHLNTACGKFGIIRDYLFARLVKKANKKIIIHYRCNIEDQVMIKSVQHFFLKKISEIADKNIVLNKASKKYLRINFEQESLIVPNFISGDFINKKSKSINAEINQILFIGHVQESKGIFEIIEAAKLLPDIKFKLAGPVKDEEIKKGLPRNVYLLGAVKNSEVRELLLNSDVFLFPTYTEGFSNALLEAMAIGLPIITTPVGANVDMVESKGGIIIDIHDIEGIMEAILSIQNPLKRKEISNWNIQKVKDNYTIENVMGQLISEYKKMG